MSGYEATAGHGTLLAIDFGTTFTVAAARSGNRAGVVEIDGRKRTPSVVYVDLAAATKIAGLGCVELLAEPVAGALAPVGAPIVVGETVAVYDLGGGTFDAAVVARTASVSMSKLPALQMAAVMGLVPYPQSSFSIFCTATGTVCSQSVWAGTVVAAGTPITIDIRA